MFVGELVEHAETNATINIYGFTAARWFALPHQYKVDGLLISANALAQQMRRHIPFHPKDLGVLPAHLSYP